MNTSHADVTIGVLLTFEAQMLDMAPIDLFGMLDKRYLDVALPQPISKLGLNVTIHYIGTGLQSLTAQAQINTTKTLEALPPGTIDILLIPGPPPTEKQPQSTLDFVKAHAESGTTIMTVCTGCYVAAQAGILDGREASGPRALVSDLKKQFPQVSWNSERRYVKDSKPNLFELWTSGGITNGLEMVAAFIKEKYPGPLGEAVCTMADVGGKGEFYDTSNAVDTAWWIGQLFRALFLARRK